MMTQNPPSEASEIAHNLPERTVSQLSADLKRTIEEGFGRVRVRGEISQPKIAGSGHCYLRLKDEGAVLDAVIWRGAMQKLALRPEEGLEVIASGRLTTYPGKSSYQLVIDTLELSGEGALLKLLEERRRRLTAEGLFSQDRKKPLPFLPRVIGVITSPTGAVIRDILHRLNDRFPMHVLLWPVLVQGEDAARQICDALVGFNHFPQSGLPRPDILIIARGGGSIEDLMAFNEESVVRAIASSQIPTISAIGHETDTTLCDFAADLRAPTPTGAAEMAVPVRINLLATLADSRHRLLGAMSRLIEDRVIRVHSLARGLPPLERMIEERSQRLDERAERTGQAIRTILQRKQTEGAFWGERIRLDGILRDMERGLTTLKETARRLDDAKTRYITTQGRFITMLEERLEAGSHKSLLKRGYAILRNTRGTVISDCVQARQAGILNVELLDGALSVKVVTESQHPPKKKEETPPHPQLF